MTTATADVPLTDRQREILAWVQAYIDAHGYSPTLRELVTAFGFKSTNGAACHLTPLRKKGRLTWIDGRPRTLRVLEVPTNGG